MPLLSCLAVHNPLTAIQDQLRPVECVFAFLDDRCTPSSTLSQRSWVRAPVWRNLVPKCGTLREVKSWRLQLVPRCSSTDWQKRTNCGRQSRCNAPAILAQAVWCSKFFLRGRRASRVRFLLLSSASCASQIVMVRRGWKALGWIQVLRGPRPPSQQCGHRRSAVQLQLWSLRHNVSSGRHHQFLQVTPKAAQAPEVRVHQSPDEVPLQRSIGFRDWRQFFTLWETKTLQK